MHVGVGAMRLKAKTEGSTRLTYTGLRVGLGHRKIETRSRGESKISDSVNYRSGYRTIVLDEFTVVAFVFSVEHLFIVADKSRNGGKAGIGERLTHSRWSGEMGCIRRGKWIRDKNFVSGGVSVCGKNLKL